MTLFHNTWEKLILQLKVQSPKMSLLFYLAELSDIGVRSFICVWNETRGCTSLHVHMHTHTQRVQHSRTCYLDSTFWRSNSSRRKEETVLPHCPVLSKEVKKKEIGSEKRELGWRQEEVKERWGIVQLEPHIAKGCKFVRVWDCVLIDYENTQRTSGKENKSGSFVYYPQIVISDIWRCIIASYLACCIFASAKTNINVSCIYMYSTQPECQLFLFP